MSIAGFGAVGRALARALAGLPEVRVVSVTDSGGTVARDAGLDLAAMAARKERTGRLDAPGAPCADLDAIEALDLAAPDVLVDLLPTDLRNGEPGLSLLRAVAERGVHAVLADKGPLATAPREVRGPFAARGLALRHGATVGGGVPIVESLERVARADRVLSITAVANGSTSLILDRVEHGSALATAVEEARGRGLLERDPLLDLGGFDAAAKAAILHQVAFGSALGWRDVRATGITALREEEVRWQAARRFHVRLAARVTPAGASVAPVAFEDTSPLATKGAGNAFVVRCEHAGTLLFAGPGAGPEATARTLVRDLLAVAEAHAARAAPLRHPRRPAFAMAGRARRVRGTRRPTHARDSL